MTTKQIKGQPKKPVKKKKPKKAKILGTRG